MSAIEQTELAPGLTARLDPKIIPSFGRYLVKARVGAYENLETDYPHSFLLIEYEEKHKFWLCSPLFSRWAVGSVRLDDRLKTGPYPAWAEPSYISPYQQWLLSEAAIMGASGDERTEQGERSFYAVGTPAELMRLSKLRERNDAPWRVIG